MRGDGLERVNYVRPVRNASLITGVVCGVRVQDIEDPGAEREGRCDRA